MDWARAITRNSQALKGIVEVLFTMLGLDRPNTVARISPSLRRAVLRLLRPSESALRRLIIIAARGLVVKLAPSLPSKARPTKARSSSGKRQLSRIAFQLCDPRKNFALKQRRPITRNPPRIHVFGADLRVAALWPAPQPNVDHTPAPDGLVNAERLTRRLQALKAALENLPLQAKRLALWRLRREKAQSPKFKSPLRPGPPPGHSKKARREVDELLTECHWLACDALKPDTS